MRRIRLSCASWRHLNINLSPRKHITTRAATFASIKDGLLSRQPGTHIDDFETQRLKQLLVSVPPLDLPTTKDKDFYCLRLPRNANVLPQGHHLVFNNLICPVDSLLSDGTDSDHSPGAPFTRRLWAGGSLAFSQGWKSKLTMCRESWVCQETISDVRLRGALPGDEASFESALSHKHKIFVDVERRYSLKNLPHEPVIFERRTLCFMTPKSPDDIKRDLEQPSNKPIRTPKALPEDCATSYSQSFNFTPAMLFRFSALTFNAHKIHLDRQHCREIEGYRDLLVHGPLLLMLIFSVFNSRGHMVECLDYQNLAPVFVDEEIKVRIQQRKSHWSVWVVGPQGDLRVKGTAVLEPKAEDGKLAA